MLIVSLFVLIRGSVYRTSFQVVDTPTTLIRGRRIWEREEITVAGEPISQSPYFFSRGCLCEQIG